MPRVILLGTAWAVPDSERNHTSLVVESADGLVLVDCGENIIPLLTAADLNPDHYWDILKTYGVVRIIGTKGKPLPVRDEEIASLQTLHGTDRTVRNQAYMKKGNTVMIMEGPLKGLTGFYLRHKGKSDKVVISIELLQRSLAVEIENWAVEKIT